MGNAIILKCKLESFDYLYSSKTSTSYKTTNCKSINF
jgi:hypothetical protein